MSPKRDELDKILEQARRMAEYLDALRAEKRGY